MGYGVSNSELQNNLDFMWHKYAWRIFWYFDPLGFQSMSAKILMYNSAPNVNLADLEKHFAEK